MGIQGKLASSFILIVFAVSLIGCSSGWRRLTLNDLKHSNPAVAIAGQSQTKRVIEIVVGARPDYFTFIEKEQKRDLYLDAAVAQIQAFQNRYIPDRSALNRQFDAELVLEQKRKLLDLYCAAALADTLREAEPEATVLVRIEHQEDVLRRARELANAFPQGVARTMDVLPGNDADGAARSFTAYHIGRYISMTLMGVAQPDTKSIAPAASLRVDVMTFPRLSPSGALGSFGSDLSMLVTATEPGGSEVYSSARLYPGITTGKENCRPEEEWPTYVVKDWVRPDEVPVDPRWAQWWFGSTSPGTGIDSKTLLPIYVRSLNYATLYGSFAANKSAGAEPTEYVFSRIASDLTATRVDGNGDQPVADLSEWVASFDLFDRINLAQVAGTSPAPPHSRESSLASMLVAEMKLRTRMTEITLESIRTELSPAVTTMQTEENDLKAQHDAMQAEQQTMAILGVMISAATLGGQLSAINTGNTAQAHQFQMLNLQNTMQTIRITSDLQTAINQLGDRTAAMNQALAQRIGPITAEIAGETYTFETDSVPDLRAKMLVKYKTRFPN